MAPELRSCSRPFGYGSGVPEPTAEAVRVASETVFRSDGAEVLLTPVQAPRVNAYAERWVRTVRAECLDWLVVGRGHLQQVLRVYVQHYNRHRPHRALLLQPPDLPVRLTVLDGDRGGAVNRIDLLGGLLHEYRQLHERVCAPFRSALCPNVKNGHSLG